MSNNGCGGNGGINKTFVYMANPSTLSACTAVYTDQIVACGQNGFITFSGSSIYVSGDIFIPSGNTLHVSNINSYSPLILNDIFIVDNDVNQAVLNGDLIVNGSVTANTVTFSSTTIDELQPKVDNTGFVGTQTKRYRELNAVEGRVSVFTATTITATTIYVTDVDLGSGRIINANSSVLKDDILDAGQY